MRRAVIIIVFFLLAGCGPKPPLPATMLPAASPAAPVALVFENEISGRVLAYDLQQPSGLAVDVQGNLYLVDAGNNRIVRFTREGRPAREFGGYGSGVGKFITPEDIIVDRGLHLYVLDSGNRRIVHLDASLNFIEEILPADDPREIVSTLSRYSGVAISSLGELTVADYDNSRLIRMDNFNQFSRYIGNFGYGKGALLHPAGLAVDREDNCFVADADNGRIAVYDDYGNYLRQIGADVLSRPGAITISPRGLVWAADHDTDSIYVFDAAGSLRFSGGNANPRDIGFDDIEALVITRDGRLYVADSGNNRVLIYRIVYEANTE